MSSAERFTHSLADRFYYEPIDRMPVTDNTYRSLVTSLLPPDWMMNRSAVWISCVPRSVNVPFQGWKIHVSGSVSNALALLGAVVPILADRRISFKFAADPTMLYLLTGKQWHRGGAGKF